MKKKIIFLITAAFTSMMILGCAEEKNKEVYVPTFEEMGCSASFANTDLYINPSITGGTNMAVYQMNCNAPTAVSVEFFDDTIGGHRYNFLVNGQNDAYVVGLNPYVPHDFAFTAQNITGSYVYYGKYRVVALNVETNYYTYRDYYITARNNSIIGKGESAPSSGTFKMIDEFKTDDLLPLQSKDKAGNNTTIDAKVLPENTSKTDEKLQ